MSRDNPTVDPAPWQKMQDRRLIDMIHDATPYRAEILKGAAALSVMLDMIGGDGDDHTVAQVLVDNETELRNLLSFVISSTSER